MRTLVLVTGPPGAGKTTLAVPLARNLGIPLIAKDTIKEALFESLGVGDLEWSRRLGSATYSVMFSLARFFPEAVLESNFNSTFRHELVSLSEDPIEVHCSCPPDALVRRLRGRRRHPGHHFSATDDEIAGWPTSHGPLAIGSSVLEVDTTCAVDVSEIARWVESRPSFRAGA